MPLDGTSIARPWREPADLPLPDGRFRPASCNGQGLRSIRVAFLPRMNVGYQLAIKLSGQRAFAFLVRAEARVQSDPEY